MRAGVGEPRVVLLQYAWNVVMSRLGTFVGLSFLAMVATAATFGVSLGVAALLGVQTVHHTVRSGPITITTGTGGANSGDSLAVQIISVLIQAFVIGPIVAGLYGVIFQLLRWDPEYIKGFSAFSKRYLPIVGTQLIVGGVTIAGNLLLLRTLPDIGAGIATGLFGLVVAVSTMLVIPAVVGLELGSLDAITYSLKRVFSNPLAYLGFFIAATILSLLGVVACVIGLVLTMAISNVAFALLITGIVPAPTSDQGAYPRGPEASY